MCSAEEQRKDDIEDLRAILKENLKNYCIKHCPYKLLAMGANNTCYYCNIMDLRDDVNNKLNLLIVDQGAEKF